MADKKFPQSGLPIRQAVDLLPTVFRTDTNDKFLSGVVDPLIQPGVLQKNVGYVGRRYGKTYRGKDVYLDSDNTLRSRYQLEPGVISKENNKINSFYDYLAHHDSHECNLKESKVKYTNIFERFFDILYVVIIKIIIVLY